MSSSQEDLVEMKELPKRKHPRPKTRKKNRVHSPPFLSPSRSSDKDVTSLFSVKSTSKGDKDDTETISELSDDNKPSEKRSLAQIERDVSNVKSVRSKLERDGQGSGKQFSFFNQAKDEEEKEAENISDKAVTEYFAPANLRFSLDVAEKDGLHLGSGLSLKDMGAPAAGPVTRHFLKPEIQVRAGDCAMYCPPTQSPDMEEVVVVKDNILELSISHFQFFHHPLFSLEHVLQEKLREAFQKYSRVEEEGLVEKLKDEIISLRAIGKNTRKLREKLFKEGKLQRERLKLILTIWKDIKKLRANQNYSSTRARLIIKKDKSESEQELFEDLLHDILEDRKASYKRKMKKRKSTEEATSSDGADREARPTFKLDEEKVVADLKARFQESFRPPDEPKLTLYLRYDNDVSEDVEDNNESDRRKVTSSTRFTVKIFCGGLSVCKSRPLLLNDSFVLDIDELFAIQLTNVPKCLNLEIFEHPKGLLKKKIADLRVEIPDAQHLYGQAKDIETPFSRREIVHYKHAGVGNGHDLKKLLEEQGADSTPSYVTEFYTKGVLVHRIGWQTNRQLKTHKDPLACLMREAGCLINRWGALDVNRLKNLGQELEKFGLEGLRNMEQESGHFRLNPFIDKFRFCEPQALQANVRLQYLRLRDQSEIEFDGVLVPNRVREISLALLRDFKRRKASEVSELEEEFERDDGKRRLNQVQRRLFHVCKGLSNNLSYESVVDEKYLIYLEEIVKASLKNLVNWFRWRPRVARPLPSLKSGPQNGPPPRDQTKIVIKVFCAKNLPLRKSGEVLPFLEICHEEAFARTAVSSGGAPVWNECVELPLRYQHADYLNPSALNGSITISVFDAVKWGADGDQPECKFWLGEVVVPLVALTTGYNLCGWFKINKPLILFGYEAPEEQRVSKLPASQDPNGEDSYIQLDMQISQSMPFLAPNMADLPSNDVPYIKDHVLKWMDLFSSNFPSKKFSALAVDSSGRTTCITRYLRPLEPPQLNNEEFDITPMQCLRYVSLIPFTQCNRFYQNLWLTSDQLLSFMIGSVVDHSVALTCFLLALKVDAYLILGYGIPNGVTSYVLMPEYSRKSEVPKYFILDAFYNRKYNLADPLCPLQKIFCLANGENVWGNAQRAQNPALLRFDLSRKSDWWPLFNDSVSAPTNFVNNKINFSRIKEDNIERELERKLKRKFCKWRPMERTNFNLRASESLKSALRLLEINAMYGKSNAEVWTEINKVETQFDVMGPILDVPFSSVNDVVKKIKSLSVHVQEPGTTDFGLSVLVHAYPGRLLSILIFVGTVFDK